ncbi:MAG TPA: CHAT domain-containing tetratricopeptide repeat protein [Accumulibacter sp.]|uniref:CHAT domain-containing protein n=1 Tax=Accumulibacter sp. TaxID=2053492 RepID=UPI002D0BDC2A|nr:CHAT domain-containing tetratricopeptide repeat protein [Accumulibacter sp.]HMX69148.1 CHAT domain-containing tetratricopeptide repeat protein [Accumulibacter sp.]HND37699.1 CHAT domain-containing tetratricopeptide repeat protein [Accumulibacter sp.]
MTNALNAVLRPLLARTTCSLQWWIAGQPARRLAVLFACYALFLSSWLVFPSPAAAQESDRWDDLMEQASISLAREDLAAARQATTQAARLAEYENADRLVSSLALLARIEHEAGDLAQAERALRQAIEVIDRIPGLLTEEKATLHNNLGTVLDQRGDLAGAERNYVTAMKLRDSLPGAQTQARFALWLNLAGLVDRRGDSARALELYQRAEQHLPTDSPLARAQLANNLGTLLYRLGRLPEARQRLSEALQGLDAGSSALLAASLQHNLGTIELQAGELESAGRHLREAEARRRALLGEQHRDTARTLLALALLLERQGQAEAGLVAARSGSSGMTASLLASAGTSAASALAQERREWREGFLTHLSLLAKAEKDLQRRAGEAFQLIQAAKHGELARVFADSAAGVGAPGDLGRRTREIRAQVARYQQKERELLQQLQDTRSLGDRQLALRNQLARERETLERMQEQLAQAHPRYHELVSGRVVAAEALPTLLRDDEALLAFLVGGQQTFLVVATRSDLRFFALPVGRTSLDALVRRIRSTVDPESDDEVAFAFQEASQLYQQLLAPAADVLAEKAVWFVLPDGPLESLPLSLLLKSPSAAARSHAEWLRLPWVGRQHALATLPSVSALALARTQSLPTPAPEPLLAFADPALGAPSPGATRATRRPLNRGLWGEQRVADPTRIRALAPLPETADEARAVAAALGGGRIFLREETRESKVKSIDLSLYRNVLFATHGAMASDFVDFGEPALVMTPPAVASELDDGLLSANEIASLRLNADWVLLSACNTAAADGTPGAEGLSGLAKSFFHAGARNLLVSHWAVVSESTVLITTGAFRELAAQPQHGRIRALHKAVVQVMNDERYRHPVFWAPFVLVGEGR